MPITIGPKGQIWILAALSLPHRERVEALQDISEMLSTSYAQVQSAASRLRARAHADVTAAGQTVRAKPYSKTPYLPSQIKAMMGGRAKP